WKALSETRRGRSDLPAGPLENCYQVFPNVHDGTACSQCPISTQRTTTEMSTDHGAESCGQLKVWFMDGFVSLLDKAKDCCRNLKRICPGLVHRHFCRHFALPSDGTNLSFPLSAHGTASAFK